MNAQSRSPVSSSHRQRGATLVVVLILLLVMTLLGLASLRSTILEVWASRSLRPGCARPKHR
jgi:type IV pilus assembly protein PilX